MIRLLPPALLVSTLVVACFSDTSPAGEAGSTGTPCPTGSSGCPCYGNMSCDDALVCDDGNCLDPQCVDGTENCPCLPSGGCDVGLECSDMLCKPAGGTSVADATATTFDPLTTAAEIGTSDTMPTTSMGVTSVESDTAPICGTCEEGLACNQFTSLCEDPSPYGRCTDCNPEECVFGGRAASSACGPSCDPAVQDPCPVVDWLPFPWCYDPIGQSMGNCILDCSGGAPCPPEMPCTDFGDGFLACLFP